MFSRNGNSIMTFKVYDGYGTCISEYTGTLMEWQKDIATILPAAAPVPVGKKHLSVVGGTKSL